VKGKEKRRGERRKGKNETEEAKALLSKLTWSLRLAEEEDVQKGYILNSKMINRGTTFVKFSLS